MKHNSEKKFIGNMSRETLSCKKCTDIVHEIILFCINQCRLKEFVVVQPVAFVRPLNMLKFNMCSNVFVSLGKKCPVGHCMSGGCGGNASILRR